MAVSGLLFSYCCPSWIRTGTFSVSSGMLCSFDLRLSGLDPPTGCAEREEDNSKDKIRYNGVVLGNYQLFNCHIDNRCKKEEKEPAPPFRIGRNILVPL